MSKSDAAHNESSTVQEGRDAHANGLDYFQNPYTPESFKWDDWNDGWEDAYYHAIHNGSKEFK